MTPTRRLGLGVIVVAFLASGCSYSGDFGVSANDEGDLVVLSGCSDLGFETVTLTDASKVDPDNPYLAGTPRYRMDFDGVYGDEPSIVVLSATMLDFKSVGSLEVPPDAPLLLVDVHLGYVMTSTLEVEPAKLTPEVVVATSFPDQQVMSRSEFDDEVGSCGPRNLILILVIGLAVVFFGLVVVVGVVILVIRAGRSRRCSLPLPPARSLLPPPR